MHKHRATDSIDRPFEGPVRTPENRAAHGNITRTETCRCGATRRTNINQGYMGRGPWIEPASDSLGHNEK